ncbi:MAG: LEA type 2 family protein [Treponema sp.]|nr:LEA type 2 family protein [Treponema sp.]
MKQCIIPTPNSCFLVFLIFFFLINLAGCKSIQPAETPEELPAITEVLVSDETEADDPVVLPPVFSITEIAILRDDLVNTSFRVGIQIDNPNPFQVELSALSYRLFGNGRLWAQGNEQNILHVNGNSSYQGNIFLIMNFIGMSRDLLNQIIDLVDVQYRFDGEALVSTGIENLPPFITSFDLSGYSRVLDR